MNAPFLGKVDLHIHSSAANATSDHPASAFAIRESYSEPKELYRLLKTRGMSLVTFTDRDSIDGVRQLLEAGLSDVFISAEVTTTFPEDGCNIHVSVVNMTEAQFAEVARLRKNVYEMVAYLDGEKRRERADGNRLAYFMAHPRMSTPNRPYGRGPVLSIEHVEKALLLFNCFEVQDGSSARALNELTRRVLRSLDRATIERLADKHGIAPKGLSPWTKAIVGGSGHHAGTDAGRTWTVFGHFGPYPHANDVVDSIRRRETRPDGRPAAATGSGAPPGPSAGEHPEVRRSLVQHAGHRGAALQPL